MYLSNQMILFTSYHAETSSVAPLVLCLILSVARRHLSKIQKYDFRVMSMSLITLCFNWCYISEYWLLPQNMSFAISSTAETMYLSNQMILFTSYHVETSSVAPLVLCLILSVARRHLSKIQKYDFRVMSMSLITLCFNWCYISEYWLLPQNMSFAISSTAETNAFALHGTEAYIFRYASTCLECRKWCPPKSYLSVVNI